MFYQDHRPGDWSGKAMGGIADGQFITGRDGHAKAVRYEPYNEKDMQSPGPKVVEGKRSDYMLMTMKVVMPGSTWEERYTIWVEYSLCDKPIEILHRLFQCYNPVRGRFDRENFC